MTSSQTHIKEARHSSSPSFSSSSSICLVPIVLSAMAAPAHDWPTYQHDNLRSGVTQEKLALPLKPLWTYRPSAPPQPAWTGPARWDSYKNIRGLRSMRNFDPAYYVTTAGDAVYFGSSVDDSAYCLDATTGKVRWTFCTDGAVRLSPTWHDGKVYFGSDDGHAYCVDARDGALVWKYRAAPEGRLIPCNGRLTSPWPCRTGVLVRDGIAYFGASLLPWRQSYLCAVDAKTGNDAGAGRYKAPHSDATMQGAMLASDARLYVPQGRCPPLVFNRSDGKALGAIRGRYLGGVYAILTPESQLVFGHGSRRGWLSLHEGSPKDLIASFGGANRIVVAGPTAYLHQGDELVALDRLRYFAMQKRRAELQAQQSKINSQLRKVAKAADSEEAKKLKKMVADLGINIAEVVKSLPGCFRWKTQCPYPHSLVLAGDALVAGGDGQVATFSTESGKQVWHNAVEGQAHGLAVANGRLFVSTETGAIHCFASK